MANSQIITVKDQIDNLKGWEQHTLLKEINGESNYKLGEIADNISLFLGPYVFCLQASYYKPKSGPNIFFDPIQSYQVQPIHSKYAFDTKTISVNDLLESVKLIIVNPRKVFKHKPGLTNVFLDNFPIGVRGFGYISVDCNERCSPWLIPMLIDNCVNAEVVISPYTQIFIHLLKVSNKIKYLSVDLKLIPDRDLYDGYFPELMFLEYSTNGPLSSSLMIREEAYYGEEFNRWFSETAYVRYNYHLDTIHSGVPDSSSKYVLVYSQCQLKYLDHTECVYIDTHDVNNFRGKEENFYLFLYQLPYLNSLIYLFLSISKKHIKQVIEALHNTILNPGFISDPKLQVLRISVSETLDTERKIDPEILYEQLERLDFSNLRNLEALQLIFHKYQPVKYLSFDSGCSYLSINFVPDEIYDWSGIKQLNVHFTHEIQRETNRIVYYIEKMKHLKSLTLTGGRIYITLHHWRRLIDFITNSKNLVSLFVKETEKLNERDELSTVLSKADTAMKHHYKRNEIFYGFIYRVSSYMPGRLKVVRIESNINNLLEYIDWDSPALALQMRIQKGFDLIHVSSIGYKFIDTHSERSMMIVNYWRNNIKFDSSLVIEYLSIESPFIFNEAFYWGFFNRLGSVRVVTFPQFVGNSDLTLHEAEIAERENCLSNIFDFPMLHVIRGALTQRDVYRIITLSYLAVQKHLFIYVSGPEAEIHENIFNSMKQLSQWQKTNSITAIEILETPWFLQKGKKYYRNIALAYFG